MEDNEILALIEQEESVAYGVNDSALSAERAEAISYYLGEPYGNELEGRSQVVTTEVQDTIEAALPQLLKIFVSGDDVVVFNPKNKEDIASSEQESEYINHVVMEKNNGYIIFYTWFKDALLSKNGYVKVYYEDYKTEENESYQGLTDGQLQMLASDKNIQILEHEAYPDEPDPMMAQMMQAAQMGDPQAQAMMQSQHAQVQVPMLHNVKISVSQTTGKICIINVAPENMKVSVDTPNTCMQKSRFVQHTEYKTKEELESEGFDVPEGLGSKDSRYDEESIARDLYNETFNSMNNELIIVKDTYLRVEGKLMRYVVAGNQILHQEEADIVPFCCVTPHLMPHRHIGRSYADLTMSDQIVGSTLLRGLLDAMYLANQPRYAISDRVNLEDMIVSRPGGVVRVQGDPSGNILPLAALPPSAMTFSLIELLNSNREKRTGVTAYNQGLDADSLNKTKGGMQMIMNAAQERLSNVARLFAETGVKDLFMLVHRLVRTNYTKPDIVRLRNEWVEVDPRQWKTRNDMTIAVGLGAGNKEQQLQRLMTLLQVQREALQIGVTTPQNIYNSCIKLAQNAGFKDAEDYFTDPAKQPPKPPQPDPKIVEAQMKMQSEQQKAQVEAEMKKGQLQLEQMKLQAETKAEADKLALEQWKTQTESQTKLAVAQLQAQTDLKQTAMTTNAKDPGGITEFGEDGMEKPVSALQSLVDSVNYSMSAMLENHAQSNREMVAEINRPKRKTIVRDKSGRAQGLTEELI